MVVLNPNDDDESSSPRHHGNHLETLWSKLSLKLSSASCFGLGKKKKSSKTKNLALSNSEIERRMAGIPIHTASDYTLRGYGHSSGDKVFELYYISKSDAEEFLKEHGQQRHADHDYDSPAADKPCLILDTPLSYIVALFEEHEHDRLIRLVPELSQVKNAIDLLNIDRKDEEKVAEFDGVPVFQSECLIFPDDNTGETYSPAFFRKEDLENHIAHTVKPEERDIITVSAFEDIIRKMKDDSTSESNNTFFIGAGITSWTWCRLR